MCGECLSPSKFNANEQIDLSFLQQGHIIMFGLTLKPNTFVEKWDHKFNQDQNQPTYLFFFFTAQKID